MFNPYADELLTSGLEAELLPFMPVTQPLPAPLLDGGHFGDPAAFRAPVGDMWNPYAIDTSAAAIAAIFSSAPNVFLAEALFTAMTDNGHVFEAESNLCACHSHDHGVNAKAEIKALMAQVDALIAEMSDGGTFDNLLEAVAELGDIDPAALIESLKEVADTLFNEPADGDVSADTSTTGVIEIGGSVTGNRETGTDDDWFAVELEAGVEYVFVMLRDGENPHGDPWLRLYDATGDSSDKNTAIASNDDIAQLGGASQNSLIRFTPTESGTYYLEAGAFGGRTGTYTIYAEEAGNLPDFSNDQVAFFLTDQFRSQSTWATTDLTYDISGLSAGAQTLALRAMEAWAEVSGITFTEFSGSGTASITFNEDNGDDGGAQAFASSTRNGLGDLTSVTVTVSENWDLDGQGNPDYAINSYRYQTYLHEVGHALGLGHGGPYNGVSEDNSGNSLQIFNQDAWNYTIMSYINQSEANSGTARFVLGLQIADILAIQSLYGNNMATRTGDSTYGFNTTEDWVWDFENNFFNQGIRPPGLSLWDAGGEDTLDFSGFSSNQTISLIEESFSNIGDNLVTADPTDALVNLFTIARGTVIENAIGGSGNDTFIGNDADNQFTGNGGNDTFHGGGGNDTVILAGVQGDYTITMDGDFLVLVSVAEGTDRINMSDVEFLGFNNGNTLVSVADVLNPGPTFTEGDDSVTGTANDDNYDALGGNDNVTGEAGNDNIQGGAGNDTLSGGVGNDSLFGGSGNDRLNGGDGMDTLRGGDDVDTLFGNDGDDTLYGDDGNDRLFGDAGADTLYGGEGADNVQGGMGNDMLYGNDGNDRIFGDDGDDTMYGGAGVDSLTGGLGADTMYGGDGVDRLFGNEGNDILFGDDGADVLYGNDGDDQLDGGADNDRLFGNDGDDTLVGGDGLDALYGGAGADTITGGAGEDRLFGNEGNDTITSGSENDRAYGQDGDDTIYGDTGFDLLVGGSGNDTMYGGVDNDRLYGEDGVDTLYGEDGLDLLVGGAGDDMLYAGAGNDRVFGGDDADTIFGGEGTDRLFGQNGDDILVSDFGINTLYGGTGADTYRALTTADLTIVADFEDGTDIVDLRDFDLSGSTLAEAGIVLVQRGSRVDVEINGEITVRLNGTTLAEIDENDFVWEDMIV